MASKTLEQAFAEAAKIASKLPKALQEAGFNRALDEILGRRQPSEPKTQSGGTAAKGGVRKADDRSADRSDRLASIDRTKHPDVGATDRVSDQALKVLQIAKDDLGLDGLTAPEIASMLTDTFRLPATRQGVGQALGRATRTVNVRTKDGIRQFHLMAPGEAYLEKLRSGEAEEGATRPRRGRSRKKATKRTAPKNVSEKPATQKASSRKTSTDKAPNKKRGGRPGPKAAIGQLVTAGFFRSARTIAQIQEELRHKRGHSYTVQDLSPALVRSVRDASLSRERNSDGQYEYGQA